MILYIDTYISETALAPNRILENFLKEVQENSYVYRKQSKLDILKYSIASYVPIKWSRVLIKLDGDLKNEIRELKVYIEECFPDATIEFTRSDTGTKYAEVLATMLQDNPWIFFSPNNDHPFIYNKPEIMDSLQKSAEKAEKKFGLPVSILYSHFTESINSISPSGYLYGYTGDFCKIIDEDEYSYTVKYDHPSLVSLQIFRAEHLYEMMKAAGNNRVIRPECLGQYVDYQTESVQIVPKVECCRHYDAYMHTSFVVRDYISASRVPPLFIPDHFFEKKIKIKYGFDEYFQDFVNINPLKKSYSFNSKNGTDLAVLADEIPAFWNGRIESFEVNPEIGKLDIKENWLSMEIKNPWRDKSDGYIKLIILYRKFHFLILMPAVGKSYRRFRGYLSTLKKKSYSN
jgi:hypothetical protein